MITSTKALAATPVAIYLRMSSDKQERSIADQRKEVKAYCDKHGYRIVREYCDEGISGWKSRQRLGFQQLIADAPNGEFSLVVCWDQSRFSRFDPMEANYFWHILRRENVAIETVKEGRLDFESLGGWLAASVQQQGKMEYVKSLAADVVRGQREARMAGKWICVAPLGYKIGPEGKLVLGDAEKVALVRRIFTMRAQGYSKMSIVVKLNEEGVKPPRGGTWHVRSITQLLRKRTYIGDTVFGKFARGKFARVVNEETIIEGTHPALIDRELWDAVHKIEKSMAAVYTKHPSGKKGEGAPLAGLLHCGNCGSTMYNHNGRNYYVCGSYHSKGFCAYNTIKQDEILAIVTEKVREKVLLGSVERLTAAIEKVLAKRKATPKTDLAAVQKEIDSIDRKLNQAAERLMEVERSLVPTIERKMLELKHQREKLREALNSPTVAKKQQSAAEIAVNLWRLDEVLRNGSPAKIRHALSQFIERIEIDFTTEPRKKGSPKSKVVGGAIYFTNANILSR